MVEHDETSGSRTSERSRVQKVGMGFLVCSPLLVLIVGLNVFAHSFVYQFRATPWHEPAARMVRFEGAEGVDLSLGVVDAGPGSPTVLVFVGNVGSRAYFGPLYRPLGDAGATIIVAPYRGAEGASGERREALFREDARRAFDAVPAALGRDPGVIHSAGYSLGTGLALEVSALPGAGDVLLVAPFARLCEVMTEASHLPACHLPWIDKWDSLALIGSLAGSVTVIHGSEDTLISVEQGEKLAESIKNAGHLAAFDAIPGAGHNDILHNTLADQRIQSWVAALSHDGDH